MAREVYPCICKMMPVLTTGSHAYEFTQVVSREWSGSDTHGRQFGSKIRAVHERARREIHVGAMHKGDTFNDVGSERRRGH